MTIGRGLDGDWDSPGSPLHPAKQQLLSRTERVAPLPHPARVKTGDKPEYMTYNCNPQPPGHALRMPVGEPCRTNALYVPTHGKRRPGCQRLDYLGYVRNLLGDTEGDLRPEDIANLADRRSWGRLVDGR
ncbi:hypothetical protein Bbelb_065410 [Branchiostoma belcheri]|nr:hypothetical protein Bbelb_065410 [Branchiostoma belcheri]